MKEFDKFNRRNFLRKTVFAVGGTLTAGIVGKYFVEGFEDEVKELIRWEDEKENTGGYVLERLDKETVIIKLLDTGKKSKYWRGSDIRMQTIEKAIKGLRDEGCEIKSATAITEESGFGSATAGLIVKIGCK